jgi:hypothetical protein
MAMSLDGVLQAQTGVRIGMAQMMKDGSMAGLAAAIDRNRGRVETKKCSLKALVQDAKQEEKKKSQTANIFARATSGQEGLYVIWKQNPGANNYNDGFQMELGEQEEDELRAVVVTMVTKHSALRTRSFFMKSGNTVLQEVGW